MTNQRPKTGLVEGMPGTNRMKKDQKERMNDNT